MQRAKMVGKLNQLPRLWRTSKAVPSFHSRLTTPVLLHHASNSFNRFGGPKLSMSQKRHLYVYQQEPLLIKTTGHLEPNDSCLKLPFDQNPEFKRVCKSLADGNSVIIQGPLQSGKTSFLRAAHAALDEVSGRRTAFINLGSVGNTAQFWKAVSLGIFREAYPQDVLQERLDILARDTKVCLFIDELHSVFNSKELHDVACSFLNRLASEEKRISYLAVGNFMLHELAQPPTSLPDTATIMSMPVLSAFESGKIFEEYTKYMNQQGILPDIQQDILEKSRGHMASLMSLFKLYHDHSPKSEHEWNELLDVNFTTCMGSIYSRLWKVLQENGMQDTLRKLIRHGPGLWKLSAWESSKNAAVKTLLNLGILTLSNSDSTARFINPLVYRACVEAVYRNQSESLPEDKVNNVEGFLIYELKRIKLLEIVSDIVCSRYCPSEASFHQELCELFRRSLPKNIECSFESHSRQMDRLDFVVLWRGKTFHAVCELRIGHNDPDLQDAAMKQALKYFSPHTHVYVVNLYRNSYELENSQKLEPCQGVDVINVVHDTCGTYKLC